MKFKQFAMDWGGGDYTKLLGNNTIQSFLCILYAYKDSLLSLSRLGISACLMDRTPQRDILDKVHRVPLIK